jgi:hypothetical protein
MNLSKMKAAFTGSSKGKSKATSSDTITLQGWGLVARDGKMTKNVRPTEDSLIILDADYYTAFYAPWNKPTKVLVSDKKNTTFPDPSNPSLWDFTVKSEGYTVRVQDRDTEAGSTTIDQSGLVEPALLQGVFEKTAPKTFTVFRDTPWND